MGGLRQELELDLCSMFVGMVGIVGYLWPWA